MAKLLFLSLLAAVSASEIGGVVVQNACTNNIYIKNTPADGGGFRSEWKTLEQGGEYFQQWTELINGNGWSVKMSSIAGSFGPPNVFQFEYTFHNDGTIWFDLSEVDGNPWHDNWSISRVSGECTPQNVAYRYSTDDAHGMQDCPQDAVLLVTLCQ